MSRRRSPRTNTSSLLINEPPLQVLPSLAVAIGLNEAMFLQQLHFWTTGAYGKERDGRLWIYNTYEQWHEQFPFWSIPTIRRIVGALEKAGLIVSSTAYNDHPSDRTKWYALDYDAIDGLIPSLPETADHVIKMISQGDQRDQVDVINQGTSSLRQRTPREEQGRRSVSPPVPKPPIWTRLDPIADRAAILRNRLERPEVPLLDDVDGDSEVVLAWQEVQAAWDERNDR